MFSHYLKLTWKVLNRRRFFTFVSLFGICFTLVILTMMAAIMDHYYGIHPPEVNLDRTLCVMEVYWPSGENRWADAYPGYAFLNKYVRDLPHAEAISIATHGSFLDYVEVNGAGAMLRRCDGPFWQIMQFDFVAGSAFSEQDNVDGQYVAVINQKLKEELFGDASVVGNFVSVDGDSFRVVGVVKNVSKQRELSYADIWTPLHAQKSKQYMESDFGRLQGLILAKDRAAFPDIQAALQARLKKEGGEYVMLAETYFAFSTRQYFDNVAWGGENIYTDYRWHYLAKWIGIMLLIMVLPAVNLINLNVSRLMERASEIGVRKAFGASSKRLVGQFVFENVVLTLVGGLIAFVLVYVILMGWGVLTLSETPFDIFPNVRVFVYGLLTTVVFGLLSSIYPAWKMSRLHPAQIMSRRIL